jgi:hypothetical protein
VDRVVGTDAAPPNGKRRVRIITQRRHVWRCAPVRPVENDLAGAGLTMAAAAETIRAPVHNRVGNEVIRTAMATRVPPPVGSPSRPFTAVVDHGAHSRFAPAMPPVRSLAPDRRATLAAATCARRDRVPINRVAGVLIAGAAAIATDIRIS